MHRPAHYMRLCALLFVPLLVVAGCTARAGGSAHRPLPDADPARAGGPHAGTQVAVLSGGCFWGMQWVYQHVKGVRQVRAGYSGGSAADAHYRDVSRGDTGHAESVRIIYDPAVVSYGQLLKVFFAVAHDPTQRGRQGPDVGSQYRSMIFYTGPAQQRVARGYIAALNHQHVFDAPITTRIAPLAAFYPAEAYHQDYARRHPHALYIRINDAPKITRLRRDFPALYVSTQ